MNTKTIRISYLRMYKIQKIIKISITIPSQNKRIISIHHKTHKKNRKLIKIYLLNLKVSTIRFTHKYFL